MIDPWTIKYVRIPKGQLCGLWLITKPPSSLWASGLSCAGVGVGAGKKLLYLRLSMECFLNLSFPCAVRVDFNWVLTIIGFALFRIVIGLETMRHCVNQSDAKLKLITTWSPSIATFGSDTLFFTIKVSKRRDREISQRPSHHATF